MLTECSSEQFGFGTAEGRAVVAAFDGGRVTSDAGALLLGATDRATSGEALRLLLSGSPLADLLEHPVATLVGQRVVGIALGYEDLLDHDELRHDPVLAAVAASSRPAARLARR